MLLHQHVSTFTLYLHYEEEVEGLENILNPFNFTLIKTLVSGALDIIMLNLLWNSLLLL